MDSVQTTGIELKTIADTCRKNAGFPPRRKTTFMSNILRISLTERVKGVKGTVVGATELHQKTPENYILEEVLNAINPAFRSETTTQEIWPDADDRVNRSFAGLGAPEKITRIADAVKKRKSLIRAFGVERAKPAVITSEVAGPNKLRGAVPEFVAKKPSRDIMDEVIALKIKACRLSRPFHHQLSGTHPHGYSTTWASSATM
jgi:cysteine synthase